MKPSKKVLTHKRSFTKRERAYFLMFIASLVFFLWHQFGMNMEVSVSEFNDNNTKLEIDSIFNGKSNAHIDIQDNKVNFYCSTINTSHVFAFCGLRHILATDNKRSGLDLNKFDTLEFSINYKTSSADTLFVYLINLNTESEERPNMHTTFPRNGNNHIKLNLNNFAIPSWWFYMQHDHQISSERKLDNIVEIKVVSGDSNVERNIEFEIKDIVFKGKWLSTEAVYLILIVFWFLIIGCELVINYLKTREQFKATLQHAKKLKRLNNFLELKNSKLETLAKTDFLTQCYNRAGLRDLIQTEIQNHNQSKKVCSLVLMDIDNFKQINDHYGHESGDIVLKRISQLLREQIRNEDKVVRWGGEEFLIICSNTNLDGAAQMAEGLRNRIATSVIFEECAVTCSFGVSQLTGREFEEAFNLADNALYKAKQSGRNVVKLSKN